MPKGDPLAEAQDAAETPHQAHRQRQHAEDAVACELVEREGVVAQEQRDGGEPAEGDDVGQPLRALVVIEVLPVPGLFQSPQHDAHAAPSARAMLGAKIPCGREPEEDHDQDEQHEAGECVVGEVREDREHLTHDAGVARLPNSSPPPVTTTRNASTT